MTEEFVPEEAPAPERVRIRFTPSEKEVRVPTGVPVFDAASWNGIAIDSTCGGHGTCKKCKVKITEGAVPMVQSLDRRAFSQEQLDDGWRLACVARTGGDMVVEVPPLTTRPKASTFGVGRQVILRPSVQKRFVRMTEPTLSDQRTDSQRVFDELDDLELTVDLDVYRTLGKTLRESDFEVTAVIADNRLIAVEPGDTTSRSFGLAFDLGTTTVVANLMDITTGTPAAVTSMLNKQQPYGADVIARISATMLDADALGHLQQLARETLDTLAKEACAEAGVDTNEIYEVALAGNATMVHLLLGIDPEPLGVAPFILSAAQFEHVMASDLGLATHPRAPATVIPALGAYVGGDIIAGALASGMDRDKRLRLFIDIGTNCEIVVADGERIMATAAPAGPAFEAASIKCGMRAAPGAIEVVKVTDHDIELQVIGDEPAVGLCGSGLVDAVAELVRVGALDPSGRFADPDVVRETKPYLADRMIKIGEEKVFVLAEREGDEPVVLSQRDVRELQFAKAAIATGWDLLFEEFGVNAADVQQVLLAGSFGTYLSASSAVRIGLVPKLPVLRIVSAGNVAGEGAKMVLLSAPERHGVLTLLREIQYIELSDRGDFNDRFVDQLLLSDMRSADATVGIIACGALATDLAEIVARRGWPVDIHPLPPLLHNQPHQIAPEVEATVLRIAERYERVAVAYADCGSYGALDVICERHGIERMAGQDCYEAYAGVERTQQLLSEEPGTYLLTDFLAASFQRSVIVELGLDSHPHLRDDYFKNYTRVVWLTQRRTPLLQQAAEDAAAAIQLPLEVIDVGIQGLEAALEPLVLLPG